uniref:Uncharacterized protein n=1 Tax=Lactuca sativa TaxID=4236 RepID=A0A9R1X617_LACSA|nr:hypothetical protein LSAT_V11C600328580 [Lactuca sativa]
MQKGYNLWKSLKIGEISLGWNESTWQLNCPDEWRDKKIKLQEAWDQIFRDVVVSGADYVAPSMDPNTLNAMPHVLIDDENPTMGDDVATNNHKKMSILFKFHELGRRCLVTEQFWGIYSTSKEFQRSSKVKPIEMKRKNRESARSVMFKGFMTQQNVIQKCTLELLESDTSTVNQSHDFSISAAIGLLIKWMMMG